MENEIEQPVDPRKIEAEFLLNHFLEPTGKLKYGCFRDKTMKKRIINLYNAYTNANLLDFCNCQSGYLKLLGQIKQFKNK